MGDMVASSADSSASDSSRGIRHLPTCSVGNRKGDWSTIWTLVFTREYPIIWILGFLAKGGCSGWGDELGSMAGTYCRAGARVRAGSRAGTRA